MTIIKLVQSSPGRFPDYGDKDLLNLDPEALKKTVSPA